ncbi:MAG: hypothetical protein JF886_07765 [Candidatus Dormibacteraeota bacterium]|uniref:Uncharacterized protein n=1 Tax=Candidatus Aeolococcus gillhamiae TaxID=3127015 RepID=A0A2W5Z2X7_9BACT|nr:hypothetical protein [Candidatus Dormibacteraeota bacterium]PZR79592.1 MAG: hypothetical protein DLM65_10405 [Candidatus Dormibacter sp. RRmetagenome_bin12]
MSTLAALTTLPDALAELEHAALLLLLAEQEGAGREAARERLARAVAAVQSARGLVIELLEETGRPPLRVLAGGRQCRDISEGA